MTWNWQQPDWPNFSYDKSLIDDLEKQLLLGAGLLFGAFKHLDEQDKRQLTVELISNEALKTSEIEGEYLDRDSLQSSIRRQFGLITDNLKISLAEQGIAEMMVDVYRSFEAPLSHTMLFEWHKMLTNGRRDLTDIGQYRTHSEPMQIVSGAIYVPKVHFEAPALLRAAIAHLYFLSIHPFEDGNGRIGRVIAEKALAQCLGQPTLIAIAHTIERNKKAYYSALERANRQNEITAWLIYFAETIINAQSYTATWIDFLIKKTKLNDRLRGQINPRQEKALARMFREGPNGFIGGLSAEKYIGITGAPRATATRDLQDLVSKGAYFDTANVSTPAIFLT